MNFIDRNEKEDNVTHTTIDISRIDSNSLSSTFSILISDSSISPRQRCYIHHDNQFTITSLLSTTPILIKKFNHPFKSTRFSTILCDFQHSIS